MSSKEFRVHLLNSIMFCLKLCLRNVGSRDEINEAGLSWQTFYKAGRARRERILCIPHYHWTHNTPTVDNTLTYLALPMLMHDLLPSPGSPNETKYQRRTCHEPVNWEQNCVCCDSCHGPTDRKCHIHVWSVGIIKHQLALSYMRPVQLWPLCS